MPDLDPNAIDWPRVYAEAVAIALTFAPVSAREIVHEGVTRYLEGQAPWAAGGERTLAEHLVVVGHKAHRDAKKRERRRWSPKMVGMLVAMFGGSSPSPEEELVAAEEKQRKTLLFEKLVRELQAHDPEAHRIVLLEQEGVDQPLEQAERLGIDIETVRNARKRITRRVLALRTGEEES
jgi:DNA-directed RNA polymerase specialized sigma24 family protein